MNKSEKGNDKDCQEDTQDLMQSIIDATDDLIFVKDTSFKYIAGNKAFGKFIGRPLSRIINYTDDDWFASQEAVDYFRDWDRKLFSSGKTQDIEEWVDYPDGSKVLLHTIKYPIYRDQQLMGLVGVSRDITAHRRADELNRKTSDILEMIARGKEAHEIYDAIALLYESRHPGMRCSMLELSDGHLLHGGAPSLPQAYCDAVHGLKNGPDVGSCGTSTYTGARCLVEDIASDPKWTDIKDAALPHGLRCCWSEPIKDSNGEVLGAFGMYYNHPALPNDYELQDLVSAARLAGIAMERDHAQKQIRNLAYTDELTGLGSRAHFYQFVENLIKTSKRHERHFSLLYVDLDDFKNINDSLGHDSGDLLLKEVAARLLKASRETDFVARLSGDEFCIVVLEVDELSSITNIVQRYFEELSEPVLISGRQHVPTCSIGIAHYPDDGKTLSVLLKAADTALYSAKELGKNRYEFYEPELTKKADCRFQFEQSLRKAIERKELSLVYQPQIDSYTNELVGVEALCRWKHPELGEISPVEFIPAAERIGMIKPLTEWVLYTASKEAIDWMSLEGRKLRLAVNISPTLFLDHDIVSLVKNFISESGMPPELLQLEVTESVVQTDSKNLEVLKKLKGLGVGLAIDDFGTGYSSFASLKHLTVDCLKIDKYFIDDIARDAHTRLLVASMIDIAKNFGHELVAEGVETTEQVEILHDLGCKNLQGYLFYKPLGSDGIADILVH